MAKSWSKALYNLKHTFIDFAEVSEFIETAHQLESIGAEYDNESFFDEDEYSSENDRHYSVSKAKRISILKRYLDKYDFVDVEQLSKIVYKPAIDRYIERMAQAIKDVEIPNNEQTALILHNIIKTKGTILSKASNEIDFVSHEDNNVDLHAFLEDFDNLKRDASLENILTLLYRNGLNVVELKNINGNDTEYSDIQIVAYIIRGCVDEKFMNKMADSILAMFYTNMLISEADNDTDYLNSLVKTNNGFMESLDGTTNAQFGEDIKKITQTYSDTPKMFFMDTLIERLKDLAFYKKNCSELDKLYTTEHNKKLNSLYDCIMDYIATYQDEESVFSKIVNNEDKNKIIKIINSSVNKILSEILGAIGQCAAQISTWNESLKTMEISIGELHKQMFRVLATWNNFCDCSSFKELHSSLDDDFHKIFNNDDHKIKYINVKALNFVEFFEEYDNGAPHFYNTLEKKGWLTNEGKKGKDLISLRIEVETEMLNILKDVLSTNFGKNCPYETYNACALVAYGFVSGK